MRSRANHSRRSVRGQSREVCFHLLMRDPDVPRHHAAHGAGVPGGRGRVLKISQSGALLRERLAAMPVQVVVAEIRFAQLVHLSQEIALLLFQHRDLHLRGSRETEGNRGETMRGCETRTKHDNSVGRLFHLN